jgi:hypothetical protein
MNDETFNPVDFEPMRWKMPREKMYMLCSSKKNYSGGSGKYIEFITAGRNDFVEQFGTYSGGDADWDKLGSMANFHRRQLANTFFRPGRQAEDL